jgi:hypothetical protein
MPHPEPPDSWERRFIADPQRAQEAADVYRQAGFEVRVEAAIPDDLRDECESCWLVTNRYFRVVYTRRPSGDSS